MSRFCVDIISKETVKPLSPTPTHLKFLKFSLIDQTEHPVPGSLVFFFSSSSSVKPDEAAARLKKSLPDMLTLFYPLAGRFDGNEFIDCDDQGINLFETRVNTQLAQVLRHPLDEELVQLLPNDNFSGAGPKVLLSIQINIFDCGGMALGFRTSHKLVDGSSYLFFIRTWAASTKEGVGSGIVPPRFGIGSFFPPIYEDVPPIVSPPYNNKLKLVSKRLVFSARNIAALRGKCSSKSYTPTRVEAVTTFLWSCGMKAAKANSSALMPALNLRSRMNPPLPSWFFGNLNHGLLVTTSTSTNGTPPELDYLAGKLHQAISKVDGDYVRKLQTDGGLLVLYDSYTQVLNQLSLKGGVTYFAVITSFCRFPLYEADFGWGKPEWVTFADFTYENLTYLTDTKCGTGIEAWITLKEELMARFECNPDVIAFTSKI